MALFRVTKSYNGLNYTEVVNKPRGTPNHYLVQSSTGSITYNHKLNVLEAHQHRAQYFNYGYNAIISIFAILLCLLIFANIDFTSNVQFGELKPVAKVSIDTILTELNNNANINIGSQFANLIETSEFLTADYTESNTVLEVLQSIANFFVSIAEIAVFLVDIIIGFWNIVTSLLKILFLFFTV